MSFKDRLIEFMKDYPKGGVDVYYGRNQSTIIVYFDTFLRETCKIMEQLWFNWRQTCDQKSLRIGELNGQCMFQMMTCKIESLLKLHEGIDLNINNKEIHLQDPHTMFIILRSIYEMTVTYYYLYIKPRSEKEREIIYRLWDNRGMSNRQVIKNVPAKYKKQVEDEKNDIKSNSTRIIQLGKELGIQGKNLKTFCNIARNEKAKVCCFSFEGQHDDGTLMLKTIAMGDEEPCKEIFGTSNISTIYRFLSLYVHPTSLGVLQFGQMYNNESYLEDEKMAFETAYFLACKFTSYFCKSMPKGEECFKALDDKSQKLIIFGLKAYPSNEADINS